MSRDRAASISWWSTSIPFEETVAAGADYADGRRKHRHRRAGDDPRRRQEPCLCRPCVVDPADYPRGPRRAATRMPARSPTPCAGSWRPRRSRARPPMTPPSRPGLRASSGEPFPASRTFAGRLAATLRYGENPHQSGALYLGGEKRAGVATARQVQGKELSYNNINDTDAAYELAAEFDPAASAAVAIIKHANPCGVATAPTLAEAYRRALRLRSGLRLWRRDRAEPAARRGSGRVKSSRSSPRSSSRPTPARRREPSSRRRRTSACSSPALSPTRALPA